MRQTLLPLLIVLLLSGSAWAENSAPVSTLLGASLRSRPAYDGADSQTMDLVPVVRYYGQPWFARTTYGMLEGGLRSPTVQGLTAGAQIAYEGGRKSGESDFLSTRQLPTLASSASLGVHLELEKYVGPMPLIALLRYRQDVDSARGAQLDLRLTAGVFSRRGWNAGVFFQTTWADAKASQYYYGLSPGQAALSNLSAYAPRGGALYNAGGLLWSYDLAPRWLLLGSVESRQLRGDAQASPLVQTGRNHYATLGLAYQF